MKKWSIESAVVLSPNDALKNKSIHIGLDGYIEDIQTAPLKNGINLSIPDGVLCPGFINSHDHLLGTYLPKVGDGRPYTNWLPWDNDLKSAPAYEERQQILNRDLYLLGGYRNLVSGCTSVQDHIPHFVQDPFLDIMPTKVISDFALAHSIASFALNWGSGVEEEYKLALDNDIPFITHIAEGFDEETVRDLETLDKKHGLGDHSVLVHGIAFSHKDIDKIKEKNASVVWCADSNMYMYNRTADIKYMIDKKVNVCIGTDSPMSGGLNLLYEMKFDRDFYKDFYKDSLPSKMIVKMITENPAKAFRLFDNGTISKNKLADFTVVRHKESDPYDSVVSAELEDIKLVVIEGIPVYGDSEYSGIFDSLQVKYQRVNIAGADKIIIGDLKGLLKRINKAIGYNKKLDFLPVDLDI